jgi:hypothetical protein
VITPFSLLCCGVHFVHSSLATFCSTSLEMKFSGGKTESFTATDKINDIECASEPLQSSHPSLINQIMLL